jgi:hypothetical protein
MNAAIETLSAELSKPTLYLFNPPTTRAASR